MKQSKEKPAVSFFIGWMLNHKKLSLLVVVCLLLIFLNFIQKLILPPERQFGYLLTQTMVSFTQKMGFELTSLELTGRKHLQAGEISALLGFEMGMPILSIDLNHVQEKLQELGWVEQVTVRRILPNKLRIDLQEHIPFAIWQFQYTHFLIDEKGNIISKKPDGQFDDLPLVIGQGAQFRASEITKLLQDFPDIAGNFEAASLMVGNEWELWLNPNLKIKLPAEDYHMAMEKLIHLMRDNHLEWQQFKTIDLRIKNRIVMLPSKNPKLNKTLIPSPRQEGHLSPKSAKLIDFIHSPSYRINGLS